METVADPIKIEKSNLSPQNHKNNSIMKALVYHGVWKKAWEDKPKPTINEPTDAIVRILKTTICRTDLHIMKGDLPADTDGRIIGTKELKALKVILTIE